MRPLNRSLIVDSPLTAAAFSGLLGLLTTGAAQSLLPPVALSWLWAFLLSALVWLAALWAVSAALFPRVLVDRAAAKLRVRGREYPASALVSATRSVSANATAAYLTYRFTLDDGRRFRVLVAGRPFHGLGPDGLARLRTLVEGSRLTDPDGFTAEQQRVSSNLQQNHRATPVGRNAILRDTEDLRGAPVAPDASPLLQADVARMRTADADAGALIQRKTGTLVRSRRVLGWISILGAVALVILLISFVIDEGSDIPDWSPQNRLVPAIAIPATVLAAGGAVAWAIIADVCVRRVRRLGDAWWDAAPPADRRLGLPNEYLIADASGARRGFTILAYAASIAGVIAIGITIGALFDDEFRAGWPFGLIASVVLVALSIYGWRSIRRDSRASAERMALRGGIRLGVDG
ncbi:hypothetical protein [Microbacterium murale]|uniref:PH domain-containing protein n=1 Tax=Microbacterium murale TaxID=1081040 RepID=A0ABU0PA01_9MICO|nr:hypothetical protein [Microbacterium murale]MDQ0644162.1 hypothetical protein [Microbacterium murale]